MKTRSPQLGSALIVTLFVIVVMVAFAGSYVAVTIKHSTASDDNIDTSMSFYAAESGLDACLASLNNMYDGRVVGYLPGIAGQGMSFRKVEAATDGIDNDNNGVVDDTGETGTYSGAWYQARPTGAFVFLNGGDDGLDNDDDTEVDEGDEKDTYIGEIFSAGSAGGYVTTICARVLATRSSAFTMAMFGDNYVTITGAKAMTDSYDSRKGSYVDQLTTWGANGLDDDGDGMTDEHDETTHANGEGNIGTNGLVTLNGQPVLFGDVTYFEGINLGQGAVYGNIGQIPTKIALDPIPQSELDTAAVSNNNANILRVVKNQVLVPIVPAPTSLNVKPNESVLLPAGTYYFDSIDVKGNVTLDGNVTIYCTGDVKFQTASKVFNMRQKPTDLTLLCTGTSLRLCANVDFYGAIYAPNADIDITSNFTNLYGSVVGKSIKMAGNAAFHYDEALGDKGWSPRFLWAITSWEIRHNFSARHKPGGSSFENYYKLGQ
jgi:hypothetical protein